ncbi:hypothetical protein TWF718_005893 [Orbilia javanica]|uniref:HNH nuclease domain-containing protein n=1 Tax=Orbilia javanica TaxID=47235 RepID=A0AAN8N8E5_9PEZI
MGKIDLETPFLPVKSRYEKDFIRAYTFLEEKSMISYSERRVLLSVISATTNEGLLKCLPDFNTHELRELAELASIALKSLRNWGGRPSSEFETPTTSRSNSGQSTPAAGVGPSGDIPCPLLQEAMEAINPNYLGIGSAILTKLGILREDPLLPTTSLTGSESFSALCAQRESNSCILHGGIYERVCEVAHIFPFPALIYEKPLVKLTWRFIVILLGESLRDSLVENLVSEDYEIHHPANCLHMRADLHRGYDAGLFSLIPKSMSDSSPMYIDVQYARYSVTIDTQPMVMIPTEVEKQYVFDSNGATRQLGPYHLLNDGDIIRLAPSDEAIPLPSPVLLFWHVYLWRILGAAALNEREKLVEYGRPLKRHRIAGPSGSLVMERTYDGPDQ